MVSINKLMALPVIGKEQIVLISKFHVGMGMRHSGSLESNVFNVNNRNKLETEILAAGSTSAQAPLTGALPPGPCSRSEVGQAPSWTAEPVLPHRARLVTNADAKNHGDWPPSGASSRGACPHGYTGKVNGGQTPRSNVKKRSSREPIGVVGSAVERLRWLREGAGLAIGLLLMGMILLSAAPGHAQTIASVIPDPALVGGAVTIHGTDFGATQGGSTVTFNAVPATVLAWSDVEVIAIVPNGVEGNPNVVVTVSAVPGNSVAITVQPKITAITVTPTNPTINVGQVQPFTATATMSDTTQQVLTIGQLVGLATVGGQNRAVLVDPPTGSLTPFGQAIPGTVGTGSSLVAVDFAGCCAYIIHDNQIVTYDENDTVSNTQPLSLAVSSIEFDPVQNKLLGVALISGVNTLVEVNPANGNVTAIGPGAVGLPSVSGGGSAFDAASGRYFVSIDGHLVTFNAVTAR